MTRASSLRTRTGHARRAILALGLAGLVSLGAPAAAQADELLVFAAASLKTALDEINAAHAAAAGASVKVSYAGSSQLAKQIEQGAPADLFISADLDWMDYLEERDLIEPESRVDLLGNRLVLVAPATSGVGDVAIGPGFDLATLLGEGRLAVALVDSVPAGRYAKAALTSLDAWPGVADRLAQAENVRAALALVGRGEAPLGIVYATDAAAEPQVRILGTFPEISHPPIVYPVAVTAETERGEAARQYLTLLRGDAARAVFRRWGFTVIGGSSS